MLRKKEERGNHSDGGGDGVGCCVLWPALGAGWMCDPGGQPSEQQQFTVAHNQPASQPNSPLIVIQNSHRARHRFWSEVAKSYNISLD